MSRNRLVNPPPAQAAPGTSRRHSRHERAAVQPERRILRIPIRRRPRHRRDRGKRQVVLGTFVLAALVVSLAAYFTTESSPTTKRASNGVASPAPRSHTTPTITSSPATTTTLPVVSSSISLPSTTATTSMTSTTTRAAPPASPTNILVEVLNGVGTPHVAKEAARALRTLGFRINGVGNANNFEHSRNLIEYGPNSLAAAETVARYISGVPQYREYSALRRNEVWVTLGATYDGVTV